MFDFYKSGDVVGVSISGLSTIFILIYLTIELASILTSSIFLLGKLIYYIKVRRYIKSIIPHWWGLSVKFLLIRKIQQIGPLTGLRVIEIPVKVYYKRASNSLYGHESQTYSTIQYFEIIDGNIKCDGHLLKFIKQVDSENGIDSKQMNRDRALDKLGIK